MLAILSSDFSLSPHCRPAEPWQRPWQDHQLVPVGQDSSRGLAQETETPDSLWLMSHRLERLPTSINTVVCVCVWGDLLGHPGT